MSSVLVTVWQLTLGLGLFLLGMNELETGIRSAGYGTVKRVLYRFTATRTGAVVTGILVTGMVQSSSMVSLLILAFASAGVIPLAAAIGVLLGANVGSTFTGWLVTALGFRFDLAALAIPLLGSGALWRVFVPSRWRGHGFGSLLFGFGLLIFGLGYMKTAVSDAAQQFDVAALQGHGAWLYALAGMVLAALVHSSAAVVMLALTALNGGIIALPEAAALVLGADLGTTSTAILGSLRGDAIKKQLAFTHGFFNLLVNVAAFFMLLPWLEQMLALTNISDPLIGLVAFHSVVNLTGLLVFMPWLTHYAAWLDRLFKVKQAPPALHDVPYAVPDAALLAMRKVLENLVFDAATLNLSHFGIQRERLQLLAAREIHTDTADFEAAYEELKQREEDLVSLALKLQQQSLSPAQAAMLHQLLDAARLAVFSAKSFKNVRGNLQALDATDEPDVVAYYQSLCRFQVLFCSEWLALVSSAHQPDYVEEQLVHLRTQNDLQLSDANERAYAVTASLHRTALTLSSLLNVNREIHLAAEHLLQLVPGWQAILVTDVLRA